MQAFLSLYTPDSGPDPVHIYVIHIYNCWSICRRTLPNGNRSVCVCVCVSLCVALANSFLARTHPLGASLLSNLPLGLTIFNPLQQNQQKQQLQPICAYHFCLSLNIFQYLTRFLFSTRSYIFLCGFAEEVG